MTKGITEVLEQKLNGAQGLPFEAIEEAIVEVYSQDHNAVDYMDSFRSFQGNLRQFKNDYDYIKRASESPEEFEPEVEEIIVETEEASKALRQIFGFYEQSSGKEKEFWEIVFKECLEVLARDIKNVDEIIGRLGKVEPHFKEMESRFANDQNVQFAVKLARNEL